MNRLSVAPARRLALLLLLLLLGVVVSTRAHSVHAHGVGTPQRLNEPAGPYLLSIWTDPNPLRADEAHVVVAVLDPATREPIVAGVSVIVEMQSLDEPSRVVTRTAGVDDTNRLLYAAEFEGSLTPGRWRSAVSVESLDGANVGEPVTFELEIAPARGFNWLWVGGGGLALAVAIWLVASMRPSSKSPDSRRRARPPA